LAVISSDGAPGSRKTVTLRGSASDQVLVLLDGVPLNEASNATADLAQISLTEVQRIEVYPQAPSSLGANAIGGVINIITLKPGFNKVRLEAGFSQYGERQASATFGRAVGGWDILSVIEHRESSGEYRYQIVPDDGLDLFTRNLGSAFTRKNADYRRDFITVKLNPDSIFSFGFRKTMLFRHNPDYLPEPILEHESTTEDDRQELFLTVSEDSSWFRPEMHVSIENYKQVTATDYGESFPLLYDKSELTGEAYNAKLSWHRTVSHWQNVHFGAGVRFERLWSGDLTGGYAERLHEYGYFQLSGDPFKEMDFPFRTGLFTGVRADLYRDEQAFVHPRLGLEIGGGSRIYWALHGEFAGAYRLPSFNSLFWQEDLQAEGWNEELSIRLGCSFAELGIAYFNREVRDLIYWRLDFDNHWKPLNIYEAWIYGTEYTLRGNTGDGPFRTELSLSHRWMRALNTSGEPNTDGKMLTYRPENSSTFALRQYVRSLSFDLSARWMDRRYTTEANTKSLSPYKVWDGGVSWEIKLKSSKSILILNARVNNIFDENYRIIAGAPVVLREYWFSVSFEH